MITFNNIVERFKIFAENHFFIETFSFGSPDDVDLTKFTSFPLMHLVYTGATYDAGTKTYNLEVYILDVPGDKTKKVDRQKEVVSDAEQCAEDIIADIKNGGNIFLFAQDYEVVNANTTPLEEETKNVLSGVLLDLSVAIPYEWDACNAPIDGVEPGGTEVTYARRGVLRMLTLDGTTDVTSVRTIKVTNGTLSDDGDGVVTLDTGGVDTLAGLTDVDVTGVTDGQVLKYDDATGEWIPANDQSATSLGNLDDVSLTTPANREALIYDGDNWVNDNVTKADVGLGNVDNTSDADKPVSTATQTALDAKADTSAVPTELNDLSDVSLTTPTGNQALIYNATASAFQALPSYTNRFEDEAEQAASDAVTGTGLFIERYYSAKADGDGIFIDAQSDTPTAGKVIVRKIYQIAGGLDDSTVTGWTLIHTFADDTAYSATTSTFEGFRDGDTYGTPPFTLAQTWEEVAAAPSFTGLLNESYGSGAEAAYSTRRLNGNYSGDCMTIRRASDGTTTSIGFVGEEIDESAIETFCTGTTCTVQVWRDQSGNGNDATQTDSTKQPTIYTGGQLVKDGGRLALDFDGIDDGYLLDTSGLDIGSLSSFTIGKFISGTSSVMLALSGSVNNKRWYAPFVSNGNFNYGYANSSTVISTPQDTNQNLHTMIAGTTLNGVEAYLNGVSVGTTTRATGVDSTQNGISNLNNAFHANCNIQEVIYYNSDKSTDRTNIEGNISAYFQSAKLLDESYGSGAEAAYSTRQLRRDQTDCMVIRRASDSTTTTIGFDGSGNIDESAITTFCTGTTCTVVTWKDQSGNGNDATQSTAANQPTIYTGGALVKENGKVALDFDGTDDYLDISASILTSETYLSETVAKLGSTSQEGVIWNFNQGTANESVQLGFNRYLSNEVLYRDDYGTDERKSGITNNTRLLYSVEQNVLRLDGNAQTGSAVGRLNDNNEIGGSFFPFLGNTQELLFWNGAKSTADRTSIEENIGDYFTQNTPLLDTYTGAAAAYSLRKLRTAYTGDAVEVYNGSSYADIGFNVFGELDTVALAAHCGSNDGFVSKWYDQSGNSNTAAQTTTSNMPKIYDGTTGVVTENGKPAVDFTASDTSLSNADLKLNPVPLSMFFVAQFPNDSAFQHLVDQSQGSTAGFLFTRTGASGDYKSWYYPDLADVTWNSTTSTAQALHSLMIANGEQVYNLDGTLEYTGTTAITNNPTPTNDFVIGKDPDNVNRHFQGKAQELLFYKADKTDDFTGIEDNINTFYSIY